MKAIVAVDSNWGIGKDNKLLFSFKADFKHFQKHTLDQTVIMGYNTFLSLPQQKPLIRRKNIVLVQQNIILPQEVVIAHSLDELKIILKNYDNDSLWVIGGGIIYRLLLPYCDEAYITKIEASKEATVFFPNLDLLPNWECKELLGTNNENGINFSFYRYFNKQPLIFIKNKTRILL